ncbi:MAG: hypothetical protein P4L49_12370 [Desulfosporosinus sp.]|nr:hypothetical protein [Desulfosporosinus sp.]
MENAYNLITQANIEMINLWLKYTLLSWQWWLGVGLTTVPWIVWLKFRRKESSNRLLFTGFFVIIISSWFDTLGILFGTWSYYYNVVPFSPAFIPWDVTLLPVALMFSLQITFGISLIIRAIIFSAFSSFIVEPFFVWIGFYNPKSWEYIYSFPILFLIYLVSNWFSKRSDFEKLKN